MKHNGSFFCDVFLRLAVVALLSNTVEASSSDLVGMVARR